MKIISIKQPWASLIVDGAKNVRTGSVDFKDIENRDWRTHHRGPVIVHASLRADDIAPKELYERFGVRIPTGAKYPTGGVIGIVDIVDCVEEHDSRWFVGRFGFVLKNPRPLRFERWSGQLGIREAPRALLAKLSSSSESTARAAAQPVRNPFGSMRRRVSSS
jgi:hypothetical protein